MSQENSVPRLLSRNIDTIYPSRKFLEDKLRRGEKLTIYNGIDPSSPEVHLGHTIVYRKMRQFQKMGHRVILLIGDFTATVGDPTGRLADRKRLSPSQVAKNAKKYQEQVGKILDFKDPKNPALLKFNSHWLGKLTFEQILELAYSFTVQQMLERDMFQKRLKSGKPIYLPEFFYPLMQAYDSVAMKVDAEIGGTDQTFNMLAGRTLVKAKLKKEKVVITCPLLLGLDGQKMSKSLGNTIGITEPPRDMYGKAMSIKDELIIHYLQLVTDHPSDKIRKIKEDLAMGKNPLDIKKALAKEIVRMYHGEEAALGAQKHFERTIQKKEMPRQIKEVLLATQAGHKEWKAENLLVKLKLASSKAEAKRLIHQGGVAIDNKVIKKTGSTISVANGMIVRVGRRQFVKIRLT